MTRFYVEEEVFMLGAWHKERHGIYNTYSRAKSAIYDAIQQLYGKEGILNMYKDNKGRYRVPESDEGWPARYIIDEIEVDAPLE